MLRMHPQMLFNYQCYIWSRNVNVITKYDNLFCCSGIKEFTNWPTIPQVFVGGEFIGGCDILLQMHRNGELIDEFTKVGIDSALLEAEEKK